MSRLDQFSTRPAPGIIAVSRHAQKHKASRAPMVNPYDKFTQPEFDAWIGDMTTSIRRALGFEQEEPHLFENIHVNGAANSGLPVYPQLDLSDQDEAPDDSFAQIKTRRDKGKARDPREGPGLGKDRTQPIEVVSSDEEDEDEVKVLALSLRVDNPDVYDQGEDAESDYLWERSSSNHIFSSPPSRIGPPLRSRKKGEVESNAGSDDEDFVNQANDSSEVISITSDDDESVDEEDDYHNRPGPSSSRYPRDESDEELGSDGDVDEIQPLDDDTPFPPRDSFPHLNLELSDHSEAPRKYAEDFYSGGEPRLPAGAQAHPDEDIEVIEEAEELSRMDEVDHSSETSSNLRSTSDFYQAYYSEGNVNTSWGQQLDPRLFGSVEGVDNDIDSFLTPGVLTPNQSELRIHLNETEDAVETGFRNERTRSLSPPISPVLPLKRSEPIPQDAEIIAIDDSDDDGEDSLVVVPPLDAILEMVTEPATGHPEEPEVSEESQTIIDFPFFPVVENFDNVGEDEILSVHTVHTEDIEHESRLHPLEVVEPEAAELNVAQESLGMTLELEPVPSDVNDLEVEEQGNPEIVEPEATLLNAVDILPFDAGPKSMVEVDEQTYVDFDDIYETPASETLPPGSSEGVHLQLAGRAHEDANLSTDNTAPQDIEVERSQDSSLTSCPAGNTGIEVNDSAGVSGMRGHSPWLENNSVAFVPDSTKEESSLEASRNGAISVDVQSSAIANGLRNGVSPLSSPKAEEPFPKTPEVTKTFPVLLSPSRTSTVPGLPQIPMPVMADANVPDPTESPTRLQEYAILSIPGTPDIIVTPLQAPQIAEELVPTYPIFPFGSLLHSLNQNTDGLFTPADFSIPTTPAEDSGVAMPPSEWYEADVTSFKTVAPVDLQVQAELRDNPAATPKQGVGDISTETDIISSGRKSVLMADPYPYCLSTPIASTSDDGPSEENDGNSMCSHSTAEKEDERIEIQSAFPLAVDIEPHINSQPASTELEDASALLTEFDLQAITTSTQDLLEDTTVEELGTPPTLDEKDSLVATELRDPFQPTTGLEDSPVILADTLVEGSQDQITATALQPLEAGVDADLSALMQENLEANPKMLLEEKTENNSTNPEDPQLQTSVEVKRDVIPQSTEAASRPSKRKREISPDPGSDDFSVKRRDKLRARNKVKQRGKATETDVAEQPPEHDTIYVRSRPSLQHRAMDSATSEISENSRNVDAGVPSEFSKTDVSRPPHPQFHAPSLFHAHGRTKRQKTHTKPIASVKQTRDQPAPQSTAQHTSVVELPPLHSVLSRGPSPLNEPTAGDIATEVLQASCGPALPSIEASKLILTTAVPEVESPTQEGVGTFSPLSSIATADEISKPTHSTPTTTVPLQPTPSLQSSPTRFLQASNSISSIRSTRSQCKYHKITLPIGENGRHVCFLVPGCSLTNQELMKEEDIEDQGEATYEDSLRMIQDIDHLDFDPYLIGTLRQLVGLDILREGEVFYLPQPDDDVPKKHWPRKPISERTSTSFAGSPGYSYSGSARSPSTRPPLSNADSVFTSLSGITGGSDMGDNQSPSKGKTKPTTWNGKTKDITSQPHEYDEELLDKESTQKTRRKSTTRGVKRTRTHDGATGNDGTRKSKRLRLHMTDSSLHQTQQ